MDELFLRTAQNLGDAAVSLMKKLEPGRTELIFVALTLQLVQLVGVIYGEKASRQLVDAIKSINAKFTTKIPSA